MAIADSFERLIRPEPLGPDRFAGTAGGGEPRRTFGGVLAAQALAAAAATVEGKGCNALHLLFLAAGDADQGVELDVDRLRDGASFAARRVRVTREGRVLAEALLSFHRGDEGPDHAVAMPDAPAPDTLEDQRVTRARNAAARGGDQREFVAERWLDMRPVELPLARERGVEARRVLWFRARERLPDDPVVHQTAIAFASDVGMVHVGLQAHNQLGGGRRLNATSLDHAIWFHRPARADEWLLCAQRSPITSGGRGLAHAEIYRENGELVASVAQELLARHAAEGNAR